MIFFKVKPKKYVNFVTYWSQRNGVVCNVASVGWYDVFEKKRFVYGT